MISLHERMLPTSVEVEPVTFWSSVRWHIQLSHKSLKIIVGNAHYTHLPRSTNNIIMWGWLGGAKVSCILRHWGVQLIMAYSWARPAILVAFKGRGGMFLFLLFLHFYSCFSFFSVPLFHLFYYLFYLFSPFLWETTQNDPQGLMCS